jgi:hypothetical protein
MRRAACLFRGGTGLGDRFGHVPNNGAIRPYNSPVTVGATLRVVRFSNRAEAGFSSRIVWLSAEGEPRCCAARAKRPLDHATKPSVRKFRSAHCVQISTELIRFYGFTNFEERAFSGLNTTH